MDTTDCHSCQSVYRFWRALSWSKSTSYNLVWPGFNKYWNIHDKLASLPWNKSPISALVAYKRRLIFCKCLPPRSSVDMLFSLRRKGTWTPFPTGEGTFLLPARPLAQACISWRTERAGGTSNGKVNTPATLATASDFDDLIDTLYLRVFPFLRWLSFFIEMEQRLWFRWSRRKKGVLDKFHNQKQPPKKGIC